MSVKTLKLRISKAAYEEKIYRLERLKNELDSRVSDYKAAEAGIDRFIGQGDDNYDILRKNIQTNIATCLKASEMTDLSIRALKETLQQMSDAGKSIRDILNDSQENEKRTVRSAFEIAKLVD
ncbi:MAG: hypothetical protein IKG97_07130 [Lachnospiraceae bacterium]|nr:hypothetical protein [Lachnospiraceae bacterium]